MNTAKFREFFAIFFILFFDELGFSIVLPIFPALFLTPAYGFLSGEMTETMRNLSLGVVLAAFPLAQFLGAPFFGDFADRYGRKKALFFTILGTILGHFLSGLAIYLHSFSLLVFARFATGFFAGNLALCIAAIADLSETEQERGTNFGFLATFHGLSRIIGIIIGASFSNPKHKFFFNPGLPFLLIAGALFLSLFVLMECFAETHPVMPEKKLRFGTGFRNIVHTLSSKNLRMLYLLILIWYLGYFLSFQWSAPFAIERFHASQIQIMWFYIGFGILWTLTSSVINKILIRTFHALTIYLWVLPFIAIGFFFSALSWNFTLFAIIYILSAGGVALAWSNNLNLISLTANSEEQGKAMGITQSMMSFDQFLAPLFGGALSLISQKYIFFGASFLVLLGFLLLFFIKVQRKESA